jgi:hypothetical protein
MKRSSNLFIVYRKNKFRDFCRKQKWLLAGALTLMVTATGAYHYYQHPQYSYQKRLNAKNPFVTTSNKEVIPEGVLQALQDTVGRKIAVQSIYTGYEYWQGKPVARKTTVEGTMRIERPDSTNAAARKEDPYFVDADIATIEKKMAEIAGVIEIKLSGPNLPKRFTGYLSTFKKEVLGIGKTPQEEVEFTMVETNEIEEK